MQIIYKVLDPAIGDYKSAATLEECVEMFSQTAYEFYMQHAHGIPYSICEVQDDGTEVWRSPTGEEISPLFKSQIATQLQSIQVTPVEQLP